MSIIKALVVCETCTKIQAGKVLDLAVVKEPFRDRFAVFGIDIDDMTKKCKTISTGEG